MRGTNVADGAILNSLFLLSFVPFFYNCSKVILSVPGTVILFTNSKLFFPSLSDTVLCV